MWGCNSIPTFSTRQYKFLLVSMQFEAWAASLLLCNMHNIPVVLFAGLNWLQSQKALFPTKNIRYWNTGLDLPAPSSSVDYTCINILHICLYTYRLHLLLDSWLFRFSWIYRLSYISHTLINIRDSILLSLCSVLVSCFSLFRVILPHLFEGLRTEGVASVQTVKSSESNCQM